MPQYNFTPAGGVPDFYGPLMNAAAGNLVRMPDGTFAQAPRYMPPSSLQQIYGGMINAGGAPGQQAQAIRAVTINPDGTLAAGGQASGPPSVPMPPPVPFMADNGTLSASGSMISGKDQSQLGTSPQGMAFAYGEGLPSIPPGLGAIQSATAPPAPPSLFGIQLPQIPSVPQLFADAGQQLGNAGSYVQQQVAAKAPGIAQNVAKSLIPAMLQSVAGRSALLNMIAPPRKIPAPPITGQGFSNASKAPADSPLSTLVRHNRSGAGLGENALVPTNSRWLTGY